MLITSITTRAVVFFQSRLAFILAGLAGYRLVVLFPTYPVFFCVSLAHAAVFVIVLFLCIGCSRRPADLSLFNPTL